MSFLKLTASGMAIVAISATAAMARDNVHIAGSSTVLPYATIVAEAFGENFTQYPTPVVESGGSGAGIKMFCSGVGEDTIDIANASRAIKQSEIDDCHAAGVKGIMQVRIGYDGIVFASDINGPEFAFTPEDWFKALAANVVVDGKIVANPYMSWHDVNPALPDQPIQAFIPGTKHGTREVFEVNVLEAGCKSSGAEEAFKAANGDAKACIAIRTDGRAVDIDGDYTETLARLAADKNGMGVFGLAFYENNTDKLRVATMSGITPSTATIADGSYPVSRPLYFYVKTQHFGVVPGLQDYIDFFVSDQMAGPDGPLAQYGLVADPELAQTQADVAADKVMDQ
ncbi:MAG: phosphonate ABC transporter substrate-binding protein [Limimaricola sp.]|uniref:substrate-binding domain-containing protein n=1 Tax=Limimaricola sp. TaxID=2211665 RepID=UPI001D23172C|nr:substrate-binding domain-containing protein [Limimaricola sp.]MBI1418087.1 phosphonate ABC transporter substrate-binding protein [Limimaricola sp.]